MSAPQVTPPVLTELAAAPLPPTEPTPTAQVDITAPAEQVTESPAAVVDRTTADAAEAEVAAPAPPGSSAVDDSKPAEESQPTDESKPPEVARAEDKKEKKHIRKPFSDLLNKILKPHPQATTDRKSEGEAIPSAEGIAPEATTPATEDPAAQTEAAVDAPQTAPAFDAPTEAVKDVTTPRKERGTLFDKIQAFVLKPMSPKFKKADAPKEDGDEPKTEAPVAEDVAPACPQIPVPEAIEPATVETSANPETPEEAKVAKKEKSPKDLAKLARRFSGRIFGVEKKKESSVKPEPTQEEPETAELSEALAEPAAISDAAPQIPADTTPEVTQSAADPTPVIAAAA